MRPWAMLSAALVFSAVATATLGLSETLARTATKGEKAVYDVRAEFNVQGQAVVFTGVNTTEVTEVDGTGGFTSVTTVSEAKVEFGGESFAAPGNTTVRTYAADGLITSTEGADVTSDSRRVANLAVIVWPTGPVEVGGSWTATIPGRGTDGTIDVEATYTLVAVEDSNGRRVAKLSVKARETGGSDPASSEGTVWLDVATGMLVKSEQALKNAPLGGQMVDAKVSATLRP